MKVFNPEKELYKIQHSRKNKVIFGLMALLLIISIGSTYALYQVRYSKRIIYTKVAPFSNKDLNLAVYVDGVKQNEFPKKDTNFMFANLVCEKGLALASWDDDIWGLRILNPLPLPNKCNAYFISESITKEFPYSGHEEEYEIPKNGLYKIELWGAGGGNPANYYGLNGLGGYTSGIIELSKNDKLYFYVGEKGRTGVIRGSSGVSFNGGGSGIGSSDNDDAGGSGGGATDVRLVKGTSWDDFNSLKSRIMVAAGGAGAPTLSANVGRVSSGGGLTGVGDAWYWEKSSAGTIFNATQTTGYKFGIGGNGVSKPTGGSGAGGGYYGGLGDNVNYYSGSGGGGSSFISGHKGCDAISDSSTGFDNIVHTKQPNHFSNKVFSDTIMIDGEGHYWTDTRQTYVGMPTFDGTGTMEGNNDNGYAKITYIGSN